VFRSQAAKVFQREAFKHAVWVGVFGPLSKGKGGKTSTVNIVIFYDPHCSEREVWEWYDRSEKDRFGTDPDELRLERVLGRKVDIVRIFKGIARDERDIEAILHAQTIYGNFKHPVLQGLRSSWYQKVEEYKKKINGCEALANTAKEPGCSKASQCAYQITKILEANNHSPLYALVQSAQGIAGRLAKKKWHCTAGVRGALDRGVRRSTRAGVHAE